VMDLDCFPFITYYAESIHLNSNSLEGSIPEEILNARNMISFVANNNNLNGTLSTSIGQMVDLQFLHRDDNYLTGTIPTELGQLTKLREIWIYRNNMQKSIFICGIFLMWSEFLPPRIFCMIFCSRS
jgi:hypothetical protein